MWERSEWEHTRSSQISVNAVPTHYHATALLYFKKYAAYGEFKRKQ